MKKSYDYFKTLKILSESVSVVFEKTIMGTDSSSNIITFFAEKSELLNNLQNEFITPLERGDIFLLAECLTEELNSIFSLCEYSVFVKEKDSDYVKALFSTISKQNGIITQLKNFKSNLKLFEQCSEETKKLNNEKKKVEKSIVEAIYCKSEQPLLKYVVCSAILDLNRKIYKVFIEIERILINNS